MAPQDLEDISFESPPAKRLRTRESEERDISPSLSQLVDHTNEITSNATTLGQLAEAKIESAIPAPIIQTEIVDIRIIPGLGKIDETNKAKSANNISDHRPNWAPPAAYDGIQINNELQTPEAAADPTTSDIGEPALLSQEVSPSITSALEAMLGGITPPPDEIVGAAVDIERKEGVEQRQFTDPGTEADLGRTQVNNEPPRLSVSTENVLPVPTHESSAVIETSDVEMDNSERANGGAEFEMDSSPIESSSDDSDSDDSSSKESEGDDAYELLGPEEQARILMEGDGGSDDEGGVKGSKGSGGQLRTKNEVPDEVVPRPSVTITADMRIEELGLVEAVVENVLLIKAKTSGEYRVLESGSVLCMANRDVIGVVSETLGRVQQPLYSVRFTNATEISEAGLAVGTNIYYSEQHSSYVFTQALKAYKGSDASNLHDEEVGDEEIEFSDDEAEMEHKRRIKQKKLDKRGGKMQLNGSSRGGHPVQQEHVPHDPAVGLNYDDGDDDGPYKTLTRPAGYADAVSRGEAPQEGSGFVSRAQRREENGAQHQSRGRGDRARGRGDRGRGQDRGQGRGGFDRRRNGDYRQPAESYRNISAASPSQNARRNNFSAPQPYPTTQSFGQSKGPNFHQTATSPPPHSSQGQQVSSPYPQPFQQPAQQQLQTPYIAPSWPQPPLPAGAFINPAFFGQPQAAGQRWTLHGGAWVLPEQQAQQQEQQQESGRAFAESHETLQEVWRNLNRNQ